jgi:hypothetical protein
VEHDIPQEGQNYNQKSAWLSNIADACDDVGQPPRCLPLDLEFSELGGQGSIDDPGPGYKEKYEFCEVTQVTPPSQPTTKIPAGTHIRVEIGCEPMVGTTTTTETATTTETGTETGTGQ